MTECSKLRCKTQSLKKVVEKYLLVWYLLTLKYIRGSTIMHYTNSYYITLNCNTNTLICIVI